MGLVTQMGNQGTALATLRKSAAVIRKGAIGNVSEVHVWTNRPVWPQGLGLKPKTSPPPSGIHWDLWLGPAAKHEFSNEIHPFKWRGYWAFGTGALGDMACHTLNMSYMAEQLALFSMVIGIALLLSGVGFIVLDWVALHRRREAEELKTAVTPAPVKPVTA